MALEDLIAFRFSQSSSAVSNHLDECTNHQEDAERNVRENNIRESDTAGSSHGHASGLTVTSMAYLPQTTVLCELRHEAFEGSVPSGPSHSGLVSK